MTILQLTITVTHRLNHPLICMLASLFLMSYPQQVHAQSAVINQYPIPEFGGPATAFSEAYDTGLVAWIVPDLTGSGPCEIRARYLSHDGFSSQEFVLLPASHEDAPCQDQIPHLTARQTASQQVLSLTQGDGGVVFLTWFETASSQGQPDASIYLFFYVFELAQGIVTHRQRVLLPDEEVLPVSSHMFWEENTQLLRIFYSRPVITPGFANNLGLRFLNIQKLGSDFVAGEVHPLQVGNVFIPEPGSNGKQYYFTRGDVFLGSCSGIAHFDGFDPQSLTTNCTPGAHAGTAQRTLIRSSGEGLDVLWVDDLGSFDALRLGYMDAAGNLAGTTLYAPGLGQGCFTRLSSNANVLQSTFYFHFKPDCGPSGRLYQGQVTPSLEVNSTQLVGFTLGGGYLGAFGNQGEQRQSVVFSDDLGPGNSPRIISWSETVFSDRFGQAGQQAVSRVSIDSWGRQAEFGTEVFWGSGHPAISANGRYVVFYSSAENLVEADSLGRSHIYLHDRATLDTIRISVNAEGVAANLHSSYPDISGDGQRIAFDSSASDLGQGSSNGLSDIYLYFGEKGQIFRITGGSSGGPEANGHSFLPRLSSDGNVVAYQSDASNLVAGDNNGVRDVFVWDIANLNGFNAERVSVPDSGGESNGASMGGVPSADGRYVVFYSDATNLVSNDSNGFRDVFVRDREEERTYRVSINSKGEQALGGDSEFADISADGRYVVFHSSATNLVPNDNNGRTDIFLHDRDTGTTERINLDSNGQEVSDGDSRYPAISADGRMIVYRSSSQSLVPGISNGEINVFVYDRTSGLTRRLNPGLFGTEAEGGPSYFQRISDDGESVVFGSAAVNLVPGDDNEEFDIFVVDLKPRDPWLN